MLAAGRSQNTRGRGRGGRGGRGFPRSNNNNASKKKDEKKLKRFHPQVKGKTPEFSFEEVKKELVKALELASLEKANDIIESVREMELLDLEAVKPVLQVETEAPQTTSTSGTRGVTTAAATAEKERVTIANERHKENYQYELKKWDYRVDAMANNKRKLHAKILKFCSEAMEEKLERDSEFDTVLYKDPIALLKRIQKYMTTSEETDWEYFELWEALNRLVSCHQGGNETPNAFRKRLEE